MLALFSSKRTNGMKNFLLKKLPYLSVYGLPLCVWISFHETGLWCYLSHFIFFVLIPFLELLLRPSYDVKGESKIHAEEDSLFYRALLYGLVPVQWFFVFYFLFYVSSEKDISDLIGKTTSLGIMCGVIGVNVGHELGHRMNRWERFLGELLLLSSMENHFTPYHNSGHHNQVGTLGDPATARKNETIYRFVFRSQFGSYFQAWKFEIKRMKILSLTPLSLYNKMVQYTLAQIFLLMGIWMYFGLVCVGLFLLSASVGILLLEVVNYIEHYGLVRKQRENGTFETVKPCHSWNSNHAIGRLVLFELTRHSDHHMKPDKPYQWLRCEKDSPQMPTGYPGMMILSFFPPLFFRTMNPRVEQALA